MSKGMRKTAAALLLAGGVFFTAAAQKPVHVHGKTTARKKAPVKDTVIQNYKVCKSDKGYAICGENPGAYNTTFDQEPQKLVMEYPPYEINQANIILLPTVPVHISYRVPYDKPGPEEQSGPWADVYGWNGIW